METIYKEIIARLKAAVTDLRYISADDGQLDQPDERGNYPIMLPAALVEINGIEWTSTEWTEQTGEGEVVITYAWRNPARFDSNSTETALLNATTRWAIAKAIAKALHGFSGTNFGELERSRTEREKLPGAVNLIRITFGFNASESLA
uniref:hypothetical protein n=1 Tax=uncultured Draconibacterium sp. TaxID=1573823 RepID=UPI0032179BD1